MMQLADTHASTPIKGSLGASLGKPPQEILPLDIKFELIF